MRRDACSVCRSRDLTPVFDASDQPALLNVRYATRAEALAAPRARLGFTGCRACGFVGNRDFDPALARYTAGYVNDQSRSVVYQAHLREVMSRLDALLVGRPGIIIEAGCGQGDFLAALCRRTGRRGIGFDPAFSGGTTDPRVTILPEPFTPERAQQRRRREEPVALVCCRHVLEHLPDPSRMLQELSALIAHGHGRLYVEVPAFEWILQARAFYDLFHEHCSLFTADALRAALQRAGLHDVRLDRVFGSQYLAATACAAEQAPAADRVTWVPDLERAARELRSARAETDRWVRQRRRLGPVIVWGAAAKGVSLVSSLHLGWDAVPAMIDIDPAKQGLFIPVGGQPVIAPARLPKLAAVLDGRPTVLAMNPNYVSEIEATVHDLGVRADVVALTEGPGAMIAV